MTGPARRGVMGAPWLWFWAMPERDLFANFARMRREMDQMLGSGWGRTAYVSRRTTGFSPNVDVYYCGDPERAVVKVDLAGVELEDVSIEVSGRRLAIIGGRPVQETEGRVYQQVEIPSGPFRCVVELQADVDADSAKATYEDGILRIELPLRDPADTARQVPIGRE
jgi:HSP20 family protein